jgi:hypothetical protein
MLLITGHDVKSDENIKRHQTIQTIVPHIFILRVRNHSVMNSINIDLILMDWIYNTLNIRLILVLFGDAVVSKDYLFLKNWVLRYLDVEKNALAIYLNCLYITVLLWTQIKKKVVFTFSSHSASLNYRICNSSHNFLTLHLGIPVTLITIAIGEYGIFCCVSHRLTIIHLHIYTNYFYLGFGFTFSFF